MRTMIAALLMVAGTANAQERLVVHDGEGFQVADEYGILSMPSTRFLVWEPLPFPVQATPFYSDFSMTEGTYGSLREGMHGGLLWTADPGYRIDGFDVTYQVTFSGSTYTVRGTEDGGPFSGYRPGELWRASAEIRSMNGFHETLVANEDNGWHALTTYVPGTQYQDEVEVTIHGVNDFCTDVAVCNGTGAGEAWWPNSVQLHEVHIAPRVVALPVPEPGTWALLLAGLSALALTGRGRAASRGAERP